MAVVLLLLALPPRRPQVVAVGDDHIVAAVSRGVKDGLVFAHQADGDLGGQASEWPRVSGEIEVMPGARVRQASLPVVSIAYSGMRFWGNPGTLPTN